MLKNYLYIKFQVNYFFVFVLYSIKVIGRTFFTYSCYSKPWTVCQLLQHLEKSGTVLFLVQCLCRALLWLLLLNFYKVLVFIRVDIVSAAAAMLWKCYGNMQTSNYSNLRTWWKKSVAGFAWISLVCLHFLLFWSNCTNKMHGSKGVNIFVLFFFSKW